MGPPAVTSGLLLCFANPNGSCGTIPLMTLTGYQTRHEDDDCLRLGPQVELWNHLYGAAFLPHPLLSCILVLPASWAAGWAGCSLAWRLVCSQPGSAALLLFKVRLRGDAGVEAMQGPCRNSLGRAMARVRVPAARAVQLKRASPRAKGGLFVHLLASVHVFVAVRLPAQEGFLSGLSSPFFGLLYMGFAVVGLGGGLRAAGGGGPDAMVLAAGGSRLPLWLLDALLVSPLL
jgi:hypothetical protein